MLFFCEVDLDIRIISHFSILLGDHHPLQLGAAEDEEDTGGDDHDEDGDQDGEEDIPPGAGDIKVGDHWSVRRLWRFILYKYQCVLNLEEHCT